MVRALLTAERIRQIGTVQPFNVSLDALQYVAGQLSARCSTFEEVLEQESYLEDLENAVRKLRLAYETAKALAPVKGRRS
jgi:HPt (histidine-containing phosphotransfer) domain-containing protein